MSVFIHVITWRTVSFFGLSNILCILDCILLINSSIDWLDWVAATFWVFWIMILWICMDKFTYRCMFLIFVVVFNLLGVYLEVKLVGHMVTLNLSFWVPAKLFSKVTWSAIFEVPVSLHSHQFLPLPKSRSPRFAPVNSSEGFIVLSLNNFFYIAFILKSCVFLILKDSVLSSHLSQHSLLKRLFILYSISCLGTFV